MRFLLGEPPDDPGFAPDPEMGWRKVHVMSPGTLLAIGTLMGIPLAFLIGFLWSQISLPPLSFSLDVMGLGSWSAVLLPFIILIAIATFLVVLVVAHEFVHVFAFPSFGLTSATVFGVWPSRFLPYAHHLGPVSSGRLIVVALAPFIVLSVVPLFAAYFGLMRSPLAAIFSILNSLACGGDLAVCLMLVYQLPTTAVLQNHGGDTWWRPAEPRHSPELAAEPGTNEKRQHRAIEQNTCEETANQP